MACVFNTRINTQDLHLAEILRTNHLQQV